MVKIGKQLVCQKFIFKIHSERLRSAGWNLTLPLDEARRNEELISIADSQILRWVDSLNGITDADEMARGIKREIRYLRGQANSPANKRKIRKLYSDLDAIQFKPDYMCLVIDRDKDYYRACKGFTINDVKYKRLLGTNGGIKNSTIVFVSDRIVDELRRRIDNGRNRGKELVTAKLEAYKALTCSASIPVSMPNGVLVVDDAETEFIADVSYLTDENDGEPVLEERKDEKIVLNASDGFGLMLPSLAERWSQDLRLSYVSCGFNIRYPFTKGMVVTFDFRDFAEKIAHNYIVKDAWGDMVDVRNVELVLTTSMVKLWDSYKNCDEFIRYSCENDYTFGVAKTAPEKLENERHTNYQYIQSYDLNDEQIDELILPTFDEFKAVLSDDWRKTILFLCGVGLTRSNVRRLDDDYIKAIMIDRRVMADPFVRHSVFELIRKRINEAKVGVLKVHGNYSIVSGDPFLLCQSFFGLVKTGLLKAGEIYNKYWAETDVDKLACFRAPMTSHSNIRLVKPNRGDEQLYWYRYLTATTVFNGWDTATMALNGCDFDGDIILLTDNPVLVNNLHPTPALMCVQRKAQKRVSIEEDFIKSNIESFGNEIGQTTNWITSMFEVRAGFPAGSPEYNELSYRIKCGQLYQQNCIDKAKGIISKPMPHYWHDRHSIGKLPDPKYRELCRRIVASRKPYFMRYIYPSLTKQYNTYIKNTNKNALRKFGMTVSEMLELPYKQLDDCQVEFLSRYASRMPVGTNDCIMNKICRKFEAEFDGYTSKHPTEQPFDYRILKGPGEYTPDQFKKISRLYESYAQRLKNYSVFADYERLDEYDSMSALANLDDEFRRECSIICPDKEALCNIVLDLCYTRKATKSFAWRMCGSEIIGNLLKKHGGIISFPTLDEQGDIEYCGNRFKAESVNLFEDEVVE